jgi:hypothetical protein
MSTTHRRKAHLNHAAAARRRNATISTLDTVPVTLRLDEVCSIYRRARSTVLRDVRAGVFEPPPFDVRPYRWRKRDVEAHLERKAEAAQKRVKAVMKAAHSDQRRRKRA